MGAGYLRLAAFRMAAMMTLGRSYGGRDNRRQGGLRDGDRPGHGATRPAPVPVVSVSGVFLDLDDMAVLVGHHESLLIRDADRMVPLPQGYVAIVIDEDSERRAMGEVERLELGTTDDLPYYLPLLLRFLGGGLRPGGSMALVWAGRYGQSGAVFRDGVVVDMALLDFHPADPPSEIGQWPVNRMLRLVGVERGDAADECAALGIRTPPPADAPFQPSVYPPL
jgi:hypothetical protein